MFKKVCNRCEKTSYSLSDQGSWVCPGCGADLSREPVLAQDTSTSNVLPVSSPKVKGPDLN